MPSVSFSTSNLQVALLKAIKSKSKVIIKHKVLAYVAKAKDRTNAWLKEIRQILSTPSKSRGRTKGRLNPHSSFSMNQGYPMMTSGNLRKSLFARVKYWETKNGFTIRVYRGFDGSMTKNSKGKDYGAKLDESHWILQGYKERAYDKLDEYIRTI